MPVRTAPPVRSAHSDSGAPPSYPVLTIRNIVDSVTVAILRPRTGDHGRMTPIPAPSHLPRTLVRETAFRRVRDAILDGTLAAGDPLDDGALVRWLGVSRTTVRSVLSSLATAGLVELRPRRSARVVAVDAMTATQSRVTLGVLMRGIVTAFVPSQDPRNGRIAMETIDGTIRTALRGDRGEITVAATAGYQRWAEISPNRVLGTVLADRLDGMVHQTIGAPSAAEARRILAALVCFRAAVRSGDVHRARSAIAAMHMTEPCPCGDPLISVLSRRGSGGPRAGTPTFPASRPATGAAERCDSRVTTDR